MALQNPVPIHISQDLPWQDLGPCWVFNINLLGIAVEKEHRKQSNHTQRKHNKIWLEEVEVYFPRIYSFYFLFFSTNEHRNVQLDKISNMNVDTLLGFLIGLSGQ